MKKFFLFNAGCIRRAHDSIHIQKYLVENGWRLTRHIGRADLIVVATCGVVKLNELNSLRAISAVAKERKSSAQIVVTGCLPRINPKNIEALGAFITIPTGSNEEFNAVIGATRPFSEVGEPDSISENKDITNYLVARSFCRRSSVYKRLFQRYSMSGSFLSASVRINVLMERVKNIRVNLPKKKLIPYFNIKIADGCMSNCAFCATKFATGKLRSRPIERIVEEFRNGLSKSYKVFQLIAEDTGCYGLDIGSDFSTLLRKLFSIEGEYRLVIIDCCPQWLVEQREIIIPLLVEHQGKVQELFVPIQSGSDHILKSMKRGYRAGDVKSVLKEFRERAPQIALRTSFLVGFPGETEDDFEETKRFIASVDFYEVTVNRYEDRPGTQASRMTNKVPQDVIEQRAFVLARNMNCHILS